mgnify:CR=1 FL=1
MIVFDTFLKLLGSIKNQISLHRINKKSIRILYEVKNVGTCPLIREECLKEKCVWWWPQNKKCAIVNLSMSLLMTDISHLAPVLREIRDELRTFVTSRTTRYIP